jgi:hypothetical protein
MRLRHIIPPLALGLAARAIIRHRRTRRTAEARRDPFAADPGDPVQSLDEAAELQGVPLGVDAVSHSDAAAAEDLARLEAELDGIAERDAAALRAGELDDKSRPRDAGDLYGVHTPPAVDRAHLDDDQAFADGRNWIEALATDAVEGGAEPERPVDIVDDDDVLSPPHAGARRDVPIADLGSGGDRGR